MSFGGFGLNYAAVGPVRGSALDYLDFALEGDSSPALHAVSVMQDLLHSYLNRVGRESTEDERNWQERERERCLQAILRRYEQPASPFLKARLYNALRSATAINYPEPIRQAATAAFLLSFERSIGIRAKRPERWECTGALLFAPFEN
jgi:hypothetical protein